jgi:hypothetical protein
VNVDWPEVPAELAGIATACNLEGGRPTTREDLLAAFLVNYERRLADLDATRAAYRARLGTPSSAPPSTSPSPATSSWTSAAASRRSPPAT